MANALNKPNFPLKIICFFITKTGKNLCIHAWYGNKVIYFFSHCFSWAISIFCELLNWNSACLLMSQCSLNRVYVNLSVQVRYIELTFISHGKYRNAVNSINRKRENSPINDEISGWKYTWTQTHRNLIYFGNHKCLSRSEESKCLWTRVMWVFAFFFYYWANFYITEV